jgi:uncharacterized protein
MHFILICHARRDVTSLRRRVRRAHLEYVIAHRQEMVYGGAIVSPGRGDMVGMLMVLDVPSRERAEAFLREEPYCSAGMFDEIRLEPFAQRLPEPTPDYLRLELEHEIAEGRGVLDSGCRSKPA